MREKIKLFRRQSKYICIYRKMRIFIGENSIRFNSTGSSIGVQRERERGANSYLANSGWYREEMDREKSIAPTLLHTELLFVVSSYRGSINAGPRIDPPRFRFRRLFVRSLRLPSTPSPPEWIHRVGPIPLIGPLPSNRSVGFAIRRSAAEQPDVLPVIYEDLRRV